LSGFLMLYKLILVKIKYQILRMFIMINWKISFAFERT